MNLYRKIYKKITKSKKENVYSFIDLSVEFPRYYISISYRITSLIIDISLLCFNLIKTCLQYERFTDILPFSCTKYVLDLIFTIY